MAITAKIFVLGIVMAGHPPVNEGFDSFADCVAAMRVVYLTLTQPADLACGDVAAGKVLASAHKSAVDAAVTQQPQRKR